MPVHKELQAEARGRVEEMRVEALATLLRDEFGVSFRFFDGDGGEVTRSGRGEGGGAGRPGPTHAEIVRICEGRQVEVVTTGDGDLQICLPFTDPGKAKLVAVGEIAALAIRGPSEDRERARVLKWARRVHDRFREVDALPSIRSRDQAGDPTRPAWAALLGLERLLQSHRLQGDSTKGVREILEASAGLLGVQTMIWAPTPDRGDSQLFGDPILSTWDGGQLAHLISLDPDWKSTGYLLCNGKVGSAWRARFPQIVTLLAAPIQDKSSAGWLIAMNKKEAGAIAVPEHNAPSPAFAPFRSTDAAVLMPFVSLLGLGVRANRRHQGLKDLLVGLTRSLTSAIDAKDSYTYGHSERVARIAVVLGRGLGLPEEELSDIYLAGLLHDIGKIGIRDAVLGKREPLNPEEFEHIKQHVTIGHRILAGLTSINHLLHGVLYHHERFDGTGYPEGLKGEAIPLLARILAVADGYDAMSTSRPYREALPCAEVERIMHDGTDTQWDRRVVRVLLRNRVEVHAIRQRGVGESLRGALDDAMRDQDADSAAGYR